MEKNPSDPHPICKSLSEKTIDFTKVDDIMNVHGRFYELTPEQQQKHYEVEKTYESIDKCADPTSPFWYHVYTHTLPPELAYRIEPLSK